MVKNMFWISIIALIMVTLVACGNNDQNTDSTAAESNEQSETNNEEAVDQTENVRDSITVAIEQDFISLDPHDVGDTVSIFGARSMYEALVGFDENMDVVPVLADDYEVNEDSTEFVFKLKEGVSFHDGEPFNADAVEANFNRVNENELRANRNLQFLDSIEVIGEYEIKFTLSQPFGAMMNKFAMIPIASPKAFQEDDHFGLNPVGTGAFKFKEWNQGDSMIIEKYEDYWESMDTNVEEVVFRPIPENGSRVAMLQTGEADFIYPVPHNNVEEIESSENLEVEYTPSTIARYVSINTHKEPFNDARVRQAMNHAVSQDGFLQVVKNGYGEALDSTMSSQTQHYSQQEVYEEDIDRAKELLAEAGYEDGFEAEIWGNTASETNTGMQFIQQQLSRIGIDVEIRSMEEATLSDSIYSPETPDDATVQMWYVSWSSSSGDADGATRSLFHNQFFPPNGANTAYFDDQEVSDLIDEANITPDHDHQGEIYAQIQETVYEQAPWIFLGTDTILSGHTTDLEGVYVLPDGSISIRNANIN